MTKKYVLEIYGPDYQPGDDALCTFESNDPFLSIHKGDILNPRVWSEHYWTRFKDEQIGNDKKILRVTAIEHYIVQREDESFSIHKLGLYTEALDDILKSRK